MRRRSVCDISEVWYEPHINSITLAGTSCTLSNKAERITKHTWDTKKRLKNNAIQKSSEK
jgi:hypothetical protein